MYKINEGCLKTCIFMQISLNYINFKVQAVNLEK